MRASATAVAAVRDAWRMAFLRFLTVGMLNTAFGYGVYASLILLGLHRSEALPISTVFGVLFNFRTTGRIVFGSRDNWLLLRFAAVYLVSYCFNAGLLEFYCRGLGLGPLIGQAMSLPFVAVLTFLAMKMFVFSASLDNGTNAQETD